MVLPTVKLIFPVPEFKFRDVAPVVFPKVIVLAFAPVPIEIPPVVPESRLRAVAAAVITPPFKVKTVEVDAPLPVTKDNVSASVEVTVMVEPEATILVMPPPVKVKPPPKEAEPLPVLPAVRILLLAKLALAIPAEPDKLLFVKPEMVLLPAAIVLLVNVCPTVRPTMSSEADGKVKIVPSVPPNVIELFTVIVLPAEIASVFVPLLVIDKPLILVKTPVLGELAPIVVPFIVPPVAVSVPTVIALEILERVNAADVEEPLPETEANVSTSETRK